MVQASRKLCRRTCTRSVRKNGDGGVESCVSCPLPVGEGWVRVLARYRPHPLHLSQRERLQLPPDHDLRGNMFLKNQRVAAGHLVAQPIDRSGRKHRRNRSGDNHPVMTDRSVFLRAAIA